MAFLTKAANRGSIATGYDIENSLKLESDNAEYLDNRHHTAGNRRTWTLSFWIKRTELGTTQKPYDAGNAASIAFLNTDKIQIENSNLYLVTDRVFRDTSAWYHIVQLNDSTQSTASNRAKLWINGVQETSFSSETYMAQNQEGNMNSATSISIGGGGGAHVNGYMAELFFVDGQALAPTDFGEFDEDSGIWKPKEYEGTLSGTSIKLDFSNSAALWEDSSGLTGNGTAMSGNNITSADQSTDTPTNNFCTLNPLYKCDDTIITDGATNCDRTTNGNNTVRGTFVVTTGKWYWEVAVYKGSINSNYPFMGMTGNLTADPCVWLIGDSKTFFVSGSGNVEDAGTYKGSGTAAATDPSYSIYGFAVDIDNRTLLWYTNGTANNSGNTYSMATSIGNSDEGMTPYLFMFTGANQSFNFGGYSVITPSSAESDANGYGTFEYAPPSGYYALCSKNLARFG